MTPIDCLFDFWIMLHKLEAHQYMSYNASHDLLNFARKYL